MGEICHAVRAVLRSPTKLVSHHSFSLHCELETVVVEESPPQYHIRTGVLTHYTDPQGYILVERYVIFWPKERAIKSPSQS